VVALIVDTLAPSFGGERNRVQALKAVAYSSTAYWVASIISIIPASACCSAGGGHLQHLSAEHGPAVHDEVPAGESHRYTAVSIIVAIIVGWVFALVIGSIWRPGLGLGRASPVTRLRVHAHAAISPPAPPARAAAWSKKMQDASKQSMRRRNRAIRAPRRMQSAR